MAAQNLWFYRDQLFRIVKESLEASLVICNAELGEFTLAKIFDIFSQILPTGFVLSTGYWPFFNSLTKQSICVCGRYGWDCRHFKHDYHWIDLEGLPADETMLFSTRSGILKLLNSHIELTPITGGAAGYSLNIKLTFQNKKIERGRPRRKKDENSNINAEEVANVMICSRYVLQREYYPALHSIMFQPSPFFYETYGTYFSDLLETRDSLTRFPTQINQRFFTVPIGNMPHFTLLLQYANVPIHMYSRTITHANFTHLDHPKARKTAYAKATQTDVGETIDLWRYKELIGNLKPLWSDFNSSPCESLHGNSTVNIDITYGTYVVNETNLNQCSITELPPNVITDSIKNEMIANTIRNEFEDDGNKEQELPTSTTQDKEYDAQWPHWGYQRIVAKKRGRKKYQNIQTFGDVTGDSSRRFNPLGTDEGRIQKWNNPKLFPVPSYAAMLKSQKVPQSLAECNNENNIRQLESYKEQPDFKWFDHQFPDLLKAVSIKREIVDEHFDIAEEFIRQERRRDGSRV